MMSTIVMAPTIGTESIPPDTGYESLDPMALARGKGTSISIPPTTFADLVKRVRKAHSIFLVKLWNVKQRMRFEPR